MQPDSNHWRVRLLRAQSGAKRVWQVKQRTQKRLDEQMGDFWIVTGLASFPTCLIYWQTLALIGVPHALLIATLTVIGSMAQEFAHLLAMRCYGYSASIVFLPWLSWMTPDNPEEFERATRWQDAVIVLLGPLFNVGLMGAGLLISWQTGFNTFGWALTTVNAGIATFNLLPVPFLDGGRMFDHLLASLSPAWDRLLVLLATLWIAVVAGLLVHNGHVHFYPVLAIAGTHWTSTRHNRNAYIETGAMTIWQAILVFSTWLVALVGTLIVYLSIPPAVRPDNLRQGLQLLAHLWRWLPF